MAKRNRLVKNGRKKGGNRSPLIYLLLVVVLIVSIFYLLDRIERPVRKPEPVPPKVVHRQPHVRKLPEHHAETVPKLTPPVQAPVSSVRPPKQPKPVAKPREKIHVFGRPTVAIIIDDMGSSLKEVDQLMAIDVPLTFSVIPGLGKGKEVAEAAHRRNYQVMLHMPMEPKDYPRRRLEKNGLLLSESDEEIKRQVNEYFRAVPYAVGANNHMGSRFTEDAGKMQAVLGVLKGKGVFFIDSVTTPESAGSGVADRLGVRNARRNVFLDNSQDVAAIRTQIEQLAKLAVKRGSAIGICHPHPATIQALAAELPELRKQGVRFVSASELVR